MKTVVTIFLFLIYSFTSKAQHMLSGKVSDANNFAIESAQVYLLQQDNILKTATTDSSGNFVFENIANGNYNIKTSYMNAADVMQNVIVASDTTINLMLHLLNTELEQIEIHGEKQKITKKDDRFIFIPTLKTAGNAIDVLKATPLLQVIDDQISILGKSATEVMINGRFMRMDMQALQLYLKSIPAQNIEKIEVITQPNASFDAGYNKGYINIILKKQTLKGHNTNINSDWTQTRKAGINGGINSNINFGKLSTNITANASFSDAYGFRNVKTFYPGQTWDVGENKLLSYKDFSSSAGLDYQLNKNNKLSAIIALSRSWDKAVETSITNITDLQQKPIDSIFELQIAKVNTLSNWSYNLVWEHTLDSASGNKITGDFNQYFSTFDRHQDFTSYAYHLNHEDISAPENFQSASLQKTTLTTANIQMDLKNKFCNLSFGGKLTFINTDNQIDFLKQVQGIWKADTTKSDHFTYTENTQAAFISASKTINKTDIQAGLRLERTFTEGHSYTNKSITKLDYINVFPSINITYNYNEGNSFSFSYNKGIDRPNLGMVNPFLFYESAYSYTQGNPFLQPYKSNSIDLSYTQKNKWIYRLGGFTANKAFSETTFIDSNSFEQVTNVFNFMDYRSVYVGFSGTDKLFKCWQVTPQVFVSYASNISHRPEIKNSSSLNAYIALDNQITLNKSGNLLANANFWYMTPNNGGVFNYRSRFSENLGITWLGCNKKLRITALVNDIFKTQQSHYSLMVNNIYQERYRYDATRYFKLSISYALQSGKTKNASERNNDRDEVNRLGR